VYNINITYDHAFSVQAHIQIIASIVGSSPHPSQGSKVQLRQSI